MGEEEEVSERITTIDAMTFLGQFPIDAQISIGDGDGRIHVEGYHCSLSEFGQITVKSIVGIDYVPMVTAHVKSIQERKEAECAPNQTAP